jgi:hypothetical protein
MHPFGFLIKDNLGKREKRKKERETIHSGVSICRGK